VSGKYLLVPSVSHFDPGSPFPAGLINYGTSLSDANRNMGIYVSRILKGEKPSELSVMQPTKSGL
jgi:hypothetical protein